MTQVLKKPALSQKVVWGMLNAIERHLFSENFIVSNLTPFEEIFCADIVTVRHYLPLEDSHITLGDETLPVSPDRHRTPLVLVPPLAASSMIFDLLPHRSVVRFFLAQGFDVYLIDWGEVTADHSHFSLENYVLEWMPAALQQIRAHSAEQELSCFAYCMGGLMTLMYAAASGDRYIRNLVTVASPVDMHQSGVAGRVLSLVYRPANMISRVLNFSLMDLPARCLHIPGWLNSLIFKMTNPMGSVISSLELLVNFWDREYVKDHTTLRQWFDDMADYPGQTIKEMLVQMGLNNEMASGRLDVGGTEASFNRIKCAVLAFAGTDDKLVSATAAHKVLDIIASEDKEFCVVPGGHAGVFAGSRAPANSWAISASWLAQRSD